MTFALNANALSDINSTIGSGYFSIGAAVIGSGVIFSASSFEASSGWAGYTQRLVLDVTPSVPEPSIYALLGAGVCIFGIRMRRRGKRMAT